MKIDEEKLIEFLFNQALEFESLDKNEIIIAVHSVRHKLPLY